MYCSTKLLFCIRGKLPTESAIHLLKRGDISSEWRSSGRPNRLARAEIEPAVNTSIVSPRSRRCRPRPGGSGGGGHEPGVASLGSSYRHHRLNLYPSARSRAAPAPAPAPPRLPSAAAAVAAAIGAVNSRANRGKPETGERRKEHSEYREPNEVYIRGKGAFSSYISC